jgi:hypothetical protein
LLQLFVADLKFDSQGSGNIPVGIEREYQVTNNEHVNWAPYWHPSGQFLIYGTSEMGHTNYEVFAVEVPQSGAAARPVGALSHRRITYANGADVLPVFSDDGNYMMWTAQRGPMVESETKPSSQVWVARFNEPHPLYLNKTVAFFLPRFDPPKNEKDAIAIAKQVIREGVDSADFSATRTQSGWSVFMTDKPGRPGGHRNIEISNSGQVTDIIGGK